MLQQKYHLQSLGGSISTKATETCLIVSGNKLPY